MQTNNVKQALRTRPCHPRLAEHIALANIVPPDCKLPNPGEMIDPDTVSKMQTADDAEIPGIIFEGESNFLEQHFAPVQFARLYEYLGPICLQRQREIFSLYNNVVAVRAILLAISNSSGSGRIEIPSEAAESMTSLIVDSEGKIQASSPPLLECLIDIEAARIRQCSECKRIFWAGRMDKFACTRQCVQRRRVRRWRERYPEHYKPPRIRKADGAESTKVNSHDKSRRESK